MSQQLREAMHDLAEDRIAARASVDANDLWHRGRRVRRNRRVAAVAALVAVVAVVAGGVAWQPTLPSVAPAGTEGQVGVPDRLGEPRSWSRGTEQLGPPGRLALIASGTRRTWPWPWTKKTAVFGVTADGQDYRWLDLPDRVGRGVSGGNWEAPVALSPDGRKVAYFLAGRPSGRRAFTNVVGWAVWDAETGAVDRHRVETIHGLGPHSIAWSGDSEHVVAAYGQTTSRTASKDIASHWWRPGSGADPVRASGLWTSLALGEFGPVPGPEGITEWARGGFTTYGPGGVQRRVVATAAQRDQMTRRGVGPQDAVVSPGGDRIAWAVEFPRADGKGAQLTLFAATIAPGSSTDEQERLDDVTTISEPWSAWEVMGWLDDNRVLALAADDRQRRLVAFDLRDGTAEPVVDARTGDGWWVHPQIAREVLLEGEGVVPGDPPGALVPLWWGLGLVGGLALLVVLVRRVRRRRLG